MTQSFASLGDHVVGATWESPLSTAVVPEIDASGADVAAAIAAARTRNARTIVVRNLRITGDLDLSWLVHSTLIHLHHLRIEGTLTVDGARLGALCVEKCDGEGLSAHETRVAGSVKVIASRFQSVVLRGSVIEGSLSFEGSTLGPAEEQSGETHRSLEATSVSVGGSVFLRREFKATSPVRFYSAMIGASMDCSGGEFRSIHHDIAALDLSLVKISGSLYLRRRCSFMGGLDAVGIRVGGTLDLTDGHFAAGSLTSHLAIDLSGATVVEDLLMRDLDSDGSISLLNATVRTLHDTAWWEKWSTDHYLLLDGFSYSSISPDSPMSPESRILWIKNQSPDGYHPWAYEELMKLYSKYRDNQAAYRIGYEKEIHRMRSTKRVWYRRILDLILRFTIGFGYKPWRGLLSLVAIILITCPIYALTSPGVMLASSAAQSTQSTALQQMPQAISVNPLLYSLDAAVPYLQVGEAKKYVPIPASRKGLVFEATRITESILGWIFTGGVAFSLIGLYFRSRFRE